MLDVSTIATTPARPPVASEPGLLPRMRARDRPGHQHAEEQEDARGRCQSKPLAAHAAVAEVAAARGDFRQRLAVDARDQLVDRRVEPAGEVVLPEARLHRVVDDVRGREVGHRAFERLGDLDAHLAVVLGDDHQHAVADFLAPDLPCVADAVGVARRCLRAAWSAPSASTICEPFCLLEGRELGFERVALRRVSVPVWSMTRASSAGTGSRPCACAPKTRATATGREPSARARMRDSRHGACRPTSSAR